MTTRSTSSKTDKDPSATKTSSIVLTEEQIKGLTEAGNMADVMRCLPHISWNMSKITKVVKSSVINNNLDMKWDEKTLPKRLYVRVATLGAYSHLKWKNMNKVTKNTCIREIVNNADIDWDLDIIGQRENEIVEYVKDHIKGDDKISDRNLKLLVDKFKINKIIQIIANTCDSPDEFEEKVLSLFRTDKIDPYKFSDVFFNISGKTNISGYKKKENFLVRNFPRYPWMMKKLTEETPSVDICTHKYLPWDLDEIAKKRENILLYRSFPQIEWSVRNLTENSSEETILRNQDIPWDIGTIMEKNSPALYVAYHDKIDYDKLSAVKRNKIWLEISARTDCDKLKKKN